MKLKKNQERDLQWYLTLISFLIVLVLGTWGYARYDRHYGHSPHTLDNMFSTLRLIKLKIDDRYRDPGLRLENVDGPHVVPWQLQTARLLLPLVLLGFGAQAVYQGIRTDVRRWWARSWRGHVILGDLGEEATTLARSLLKSGRRVVCVDPGGPSKSPGSLERKGAVVRKGDASDVESLQAAGLAGASAVVALNPTAGRNLEILLAAERGRRAISVDATQDRLVGVANVDDPIVLSGLQQLSRPVVDGEGMSARLFSGPVAIVRDLWRRWPLERDATAWGHDELHVILIGMGAVGSQIALRFAQLGHAPGIARRRLTVVDRDARAVASFRRHHPWFESLCTLEAVEADATEGARLVAEEAGLDEWTSGIVVTLGDDDSALRCAFDFAEAVASTRAAVPVRVRMGRHPQLASVLGGRTLLELGGASLGFFGDLDRLWTQETILGETQDRLARAIHDHYLRNWGATSSSPAAVPWDRLAELYKTSSRLQADHVELKLRAIGARLISESTQDFRLTDDELETLARLEHDRWCADRISAGWSLGPKIDPTRREHPSLIPFDELSQEEQDKDRTAVSAIPDVLAGANLGIRREQRLLVTGRTNLPEDPEVAARRMGDALKALRSRDREPVLYSTYLHEVELRVAERWSGRRVALVPSGLSAAALEVLVGGQLRQRFEHLNASADGHLRLHLDGAAESEKALLPLLDTAAEALASKDTSLQRVEFGADVPQRS